MAGHQSTSIRKSDKLLHAALYDTGIVKKAGGVSPRLGEPAADVIECSRAPYYLLETPGAAYKHEELT